MQKNELIILFIVIQPLAIYIINYIVYIVHKELSCEMKQIQDRLKPDPTTNFIDV